MGKLSERAQCHANLIDRAQSYPPARHLRDLADELDRLEAENQRWQQECGPLLDFLTGSSQLCDQPIDYAQELVADNDRLEARVRELEADGRRLEWVISHAAGVEPVAGQGRWLCEYTPAVDGTALEIATGDSFREAIDAAMKETER